MTYNFLDDQAKARGMTVSEMMRERGRKGGSSGRGKKLSEKHRKAISRGRRAKQQQITAS